MIWPLILWSVSHRNSGSVASFVHTISIYLKTVYTCDLWSFQTARDENSVPAMTYQVHWSCRELDITWDILKIWSPRAIWILQPEHIIQSSFNSFKCQPIPTTSFNKSNTSNQQNPTNPGGWILLLSFNMIRHAGSWIISAGKSPCSKNIIPNWKTDYSYPSENIYSYQYVISGFALYIYIYILY